MECIVQANLAVPDMEPSCIFSCFCGYSDDSPILFPLFLCSDVLFLPHLCFAFSAWNTVQAFASERRSCYFAMLCDLRSRAGSVFSSRIWLPTLSPNAISRFPKFAHFSHSFWTVHISLFIGFILVGGAYLEDSGITA